MHKFYQLVTPNDKVFTFVFILNKSNEIIYYNNMENMYPDDCAEFTMEYISENSIDRDTYVKYLLVLDDIFINYCSSWNFTKTDKADQLYTSSLCLATTHASWYLNHSLDEFIKLETKRIALAYRNIHETKCERRKRLTLERCELETRLAHERAQEKRERKEMLELIKQHERAEKRRELEEQKYREKLNEMEHRIPYAHSHQIMEAYLESKDYVSHIYDT